MINLEQIKDRVSQGELIEKIIEEMNWKEFEKIVGEILRTHDFNVYNSFRFKIRKNYEIDVIGIKQNIILGIDCKKWKGGRYKNSGLKYAISKQKKRTVEFINFLKNNPNEKKFFGIEIKKIKLVPLIVTWLEEDLKIYDNIVVVPIWKLNEFLLNISEYT
jgi:Holliday junction resolvase-like predicted endonuclease